MVPVRFDTVNCRGTFDHGDGVRPVKQADRNMRRSRGSGRSAFTLIESLLAILLLAVAGMLLLVATEGVINTAQESHERMLADALARELLDEIVSRPFESSMATSVVPTRRATFQTIWDYDGYRAGPPVDMWGVPCGVGDDAGGERRPEFQAPSEWFAGMERYVQIVFLDSATLAPLPTDGTTSDTVRITVGVVRRDPGGAVRPLATQHRIVTNAGLGGW